MRRLLFMVLGISLVSSGFGTVGAQSGDGSERTVPLAFGESALIDEYEVSVIAVDPDAYEAIAAANQFVEVPAPGNVFFVVTVEVTYAGAGSADPAFELAFNAVGDQNRGYDGLDLACGFIENSTFEIGELFTDGTAEANACWEVPADEAPSLVMYVESLFSFDDETRVYFSLDEDDAGTPEASPVVN